MSNKGDEAFYNSLESPRRYPSQKTTDTLNDYDYTNVNENYQKLNPASAMAKNMYSSLMKSGSGKTQVPQDYLTPISEHLKEHFKLSNATSPVTVDKGESSKTEQSTYLCLLLLLTCISLLVAISAVVLAVLALSKANNSIDMASSDNRTIAVTEEVRANDSYSTIELDNKLLEVYINITAQLSTLISSINYVESTAYTLYKEIESTKGVCLNKWITVN